MINIRYIHYNNDYDKQANSATFNSLEGLAKWLYSGKSFSISNAVKNKDVKNLVSHSGITRSVDGYLDYITLIEDDRAVLYSTGAYTNGRKHISSVIQNFAINIDNYSNGLVFVD